MGIRRRSRVGVDDLRSSGRPSRARRGLLAGAVAVALPTAVLTVLPASPASAVTCSPITTTPAAGLNQLVFTNTSPCDWAPPVGVSTVDVLVVGGGGGGSGGSSASGPFVWVGGNGGGGGNVTFRTSFSVGASVSVAAGVGGSAGGAGASGVSGTATAGGTGGTSSFGGLSAAGGSGGAAVNLYNTVTTGGGSGNSVNGVQSAYSGGNSSSGAYGYANVGVAAGGAGSGGTTVSCTPDAAAGFPTASINGAWGGSSPYTGPNAGCGSDGYQPTLGLFTGSTAYYGGGGGGGHSDSGRSIFTGDGGRGGGGHGGMSDGSPPDPTASTGGGGGGGYARTSSNNGAAGATGVIVVRYNDPPPSLSPVSQSVAGMPGTAITSTSALAASGFSGSVSYSIVPSLPSGLSLDPSTGVVSGTPSSASTNTYTITGLGATSGSATATLTITITASGGGGSSSGGGGSSDVSESPSVSPSVSASAVVLPNLDPIPNRVNGNVPAGGVPQGGSVYLVNGVPVPVTVSPDAVQDPTGLEVKGPDFFMRLAGYGDDADPLGLTPQQRALILQSRQQQGRSGVVSAAVDGSGAGVGVVARSGSREPRSGVLARCVLRQPMAVSSGNGFKAGSPVKFYLLPATYIGELTADASGAYSGSLPIPVGVAAGSQTLQANGFAPSGQVRSLSLGILVKPGRVVTTASEKAKVSFAPLSPVISAAGKKQLNALARKATKHGVRTVVVGFVQRTSSTGNDRSLSTLRARNVAAYLRGRGLTGAYVIRGDGVAGSGDAARRVNVTVTYQTGCQRT